MIHVVVIDPLVFAELDQYWKLFAQQFGASRGRLICEFPKGWKKLVFEDFQTTYRGQVAFEELRKVLGEKSFVRRKGSTAAGETWLERAFDEHSKDPFSLIVVSSKAAESTGLDLPLCRSEDVADFEVPVSQSVRRSLPDLFTPAAKLLRYSRRVRFVDPYFSPHQEQWRASVKCLLELCASDDVVKTFIEFHTMVDQRDAEPFEEWRKSCELLCSSIPSGLKLKVVRWDVGTETQEKLHDRYILTELGGLKYGWGLGAEAHWKGTSQTTMNRLEYTHCVQLFGEFDEDAVRYRFVDNVTIKAQ